MKRTIVWSVLVVLTHLSSQSKAQSSDDVARRLNGMSRLVANPQRLADSTMPVVETLFVWERVTT